MTDRSSQPDFSLYPKNSFRRILEKAIVVLTGLTGTQYSGPRKQDSHLR